MQQEISKTSYETPVVAELGTVEQLTQGTVDGHGSCVAPIKLPELNA